MAPGASPDALLAAYAAALAASDPARVVREGLAAHEVALETGRDRPHWILATGKAAPAMAGAAVAFCRDAARRIAGGLIVGAAPSAPPAPGIITGVGDHPVPGARSAAAAAQVEAFAERVAPDDVVLVLISGGTSSLIGAPIPGVRAEDFAALHALLLSAGVPIGRTNAVRKRFARWGAGRLAVALRQAQVIPICLADVPNEDPAMIGSGPISPDPLTAAHVEQILRDAGIATRIPLSIASALGAVRHRVAGETPKPGDAAFARVADPFVVGNGAALEAIAGVAQRVGGAPVLLARTPLQGDATAAGRTIAHAVARAAPGTWLIWGGETTVRLPAGHGTGGRCQQLALAAAEVFAEAGAPATLLAAGTDGRDGPTDAAGALVDATTWGAVRAAGVDPAAALRHCDAHAALAAAGALLPARATGTNVMDVVVARRS
ncbi:MAG: hypothetical protein RL139_486 [Gemmatimonadota bacterium]